MPFLTNTVRPELVEGPFFLSIEAMAFWVYMLHCRGGSFYTGQTDDLEARLAAHQIGQVPGFTSDRLPVKLVWCQEFPTRVEALASERQIKGWSRAKKMAMIRGDWSRLSDLAKGRTALRQAQDERKSGGLPDGRAQDERKSGGHPDGRAQDEQKSEGYVA